MSTLEKILSSDILKQLGGVADMLVGAAILVAILIFLLHTIYILGQRSIMYRKKPPVDGWSRRFYPACILLIIFLLALMWLLSAWRHTYLGS